MNEQGHWVTIQGRKVFLTDDPVEKRDKEIAEREQAIKELNDATFFDTEDPFAPGKHNINTEGGNLRYSIKTEREKPYIWVHGIAVDEDKRNKGIGSVLLSELLKVSDKTGFPIELFATPIRNNKMTDEELIEWYLKRGFQHTTGIGNALIYIPTRNRKKSK